MHTEATHTTRDRWAREQPPVVVGVDGVGAGGWQALAWARDEVAATGGRLTVCRVGPPPPGGTTMSALELVNPALARAVHGVRQRLGGERVALRFVPGDPVTGLCAAAEEARLLVVGAPAGRDADASVAVRVAGAATRPVIVVRPERGGRVGPFAGHVVVAVAGESVAPPALAFGFGYAADHRLPLAAVHVTAGAAGDYWFDEATLETHFFVEPRAMRMLSAVVEPLMPVYPDVPVKLMALAGDPVARLGADVAAYARLTVLARRARRPGHRALGPVGRALVVTGPGPVAVVPPHWFP